VVQPRNCVDVPCSRSEGMCGHDSKTVAATACPELHLSKRGPTPRAGHRIVRRDPCLPRAVSWRYPPGHLVLVDWAVRWGWGRTSGSGPGHRTLPISRSECTTNDRPFRGPASLRARAAARRWSVRPRFAPRARCAAAARRFCAHRATPHNRRRAPSSDTCLAESDVTGSCVRWSGLHAGDEVVQ
jgi:hypothetical protein